MTETQIAWLAGWLEGEGTFYAHTEAPRTPTRKPYTRLTVRACSVDLETIKKAQSFAGGGVWGPYQYTENRQPHYQWGISGKKKAGEFMRMIRPYMGSRRQSQIDAALERANV